MEEISEVYARSLFEVARDEDKLDDVREQLGEIADAVSENRDLQTFFFSPYFSTDEKVEGLDKVVTGADETVQNFLTLLVEKHRMPALFRIRQRFESSASANSPSCSRTVSSFSFSCATSKRERA